MYSRVMQSAVLAAAQGYPIITLLGPRQSGKTTLAQQTFAEKPYRSLENPDTLARAQSDPRGFLDTLPDGAILDEVQRMPELLSYIQGIVDTYRAGEFILTGSHQSTLKTGIGQTLAGRTALFRLLPLSRNELAVGAFDLWTEILTGAYPRLRRDNLEHGLFYASYLQTFLDRDLRAQLQVRDINQFREFMRLLAGRVGQLVNFSNLANDIGASANTIKQWIAALEAAYLIFRLPPYYENFSKRVIKSPKVYFTDTGLACALLGIETENQLQRDPLAGGLAENWAILEYLKQRWNHGKEAHIYFYRDRHGNEIDLLIAAGRSLTPVEIKSAQTFSSHFIKGIQRFRDLAGERVRPGYVIYNGADRGQVKGVTLLGFDEVAEINNDR